MNNEITEYATKECPVCKTRLFADMETCYGCLHDFHHEPAVDQVPVVNELFDHEPERYDDRPIEPTPLNSQPAGVNTSNSALSVSENDGAWTLRIELQEGNAPARAWSIELMPSDASVQLLDEHS